MCGASRGLLVAKSPPSAMGSRPSCIVSWVGRCVVSRDGLSGHQMALPRSSQLWPSEAPPGLNGCVGRGVKTMGVGESTSSPSPTDFTCLGYIVNWGALEMMKWFQPRLSSCINHLSLDLPHLCIYVPHCPYGDDKCDTNDTILEDLVLGGRLLPWCYRERDPWNGCRTHRWRLAPEQLPDRR